MGLWVVRERLCVPMDTEKVVDVAEAGSARFIFEEVLKDYCRDV